MIARSVFIIQFNCLLISIYIHANSVGQTSLQFTCENVSKVEKFTSEYMSEASCVFWRIGFRPQPLYCVSAASLEMSSV